MDITFWVSSNTNAKLWDCEDTVSTLGYSSDMDVAFWVTGHTVLVLSHPSHTDAAHVSNAAHAYRCNSLI